MMAASPATLRPSSSAPQYPLTTSDTISMSTISVSSGSFGVVSAQATHSDFASLRTVVYRLQTTMGRLAVNTYQCRVLYRRLQTIFDTLQLMRCRDPTPQLLSVFRAAEYTVFRMSSDGPWPHILQHLFTCNAIFDCLRSRVRSVWSLHSTAHWEREDRTAVEDDERENCRVILAHPSLMPKALRTELQSEGILALGDDDDAFGVDSFAMCQSSCHETDPPSRSVVSDAVLTAAMPKILRFYRRRFSSSWKLNASTDIVPLPALPSTPAQVAAATWTADLDAALPSDEGGVAECVNPLHPAAATVDCAAPISVAGAAAVEEVLPSSFTLRDIVPPSDAMPFTAVRPPLTHSPASHGAPPHNGDLRVDLLPPHVHKHHKWLLDDAQPHAAGEVEMHPVAATAVHSITRFATRFHVDGSERFSFRGQTVVVKRLRDKALLSAATLEAFVMDAAARVRWSHPNLVAVMGAFSEEFTTQATTHRNPIRGEGPSDSQPHQLAPHDDADEGLPFLSLGLVMVDVAQLHVFPRSYVPLQRLLFVDGMHLPLTSCISIVLQVADAVQYISFDRDDVPPGVAAAWMCLSPSNVFVYDRALDADTANTVSPKGEDRFEIQFAPPCYIENGPSNRWAPHPHAVSPIVYGLTQLFLALLTNQQPYGGLSSQIALQVMFDQLRRRQPSAATHPIHNPDGIGLLVPHTLPPPFQTLCRRGLEVKPAAVPVAQQQPLRRTSAGSTSGTSRPGVVPMTIQQFREALHGLMPLAHRLSLAESDIGSQDTTPSNLCRRFLVEPWVDDYGVVTTSSGSEAMSCSFDGHSV